MTDRTCALSEDDVEEAKRQRKLRWRHFRKYPMFYFGGGLLLVVIAVSICAPWVASHDVLAMNPLVRLKPPSGAHYFGTDALGRDVFSRTVWGGRVSLIVAISVTALATVFGIFLGVAAGFIRWADGMIMRIMDGMMAIPDILLAIALVAIVRPSLTTVIVAITVPQVPRMVRLVRSLALSLREQQFVEAAHAIGTRLPAILWRHVIPNMLAPVVVQATFIAASAVLTEAVLSFLGVGVPAQLPSWGNIIADGRNVVAQAPHIILFPGIFLALTVLSINTLGDGLRDRLDSRLANQL